jgi:hypothetical protein
MFPGGLNAKQMESINHDFALLRSISPSTRTKNPKFQCSIRSLAPFCQLLVVSNAKFSLFLIQFPVCRTTNSMVSDRGIFNMPYPMTCGVFTRAYVHEDWISTGCRISEDDLGLTFMNQRTR